MAKGVVYTIVFCSFACFASPNKKPPVSVSSSQATAYANASIAAMTGGITVTDATLTGSATWTAGSDIENGTATFLASGTGESRMDLALSNGTHTEIRDASTSTAEGKWIAQTTISGSFAHHNCLTDAVWFFPVLGSLAGGSNVVFSYVGQETLNGSAVQHIQSYINLPVQPPASGPTLQQLSTMDFYLDATTFLPAAVAFNVHPDTNAASNIPVQIAFSSYQNIGGVIVPTHIQKYLQGTLQIDITISSATFNTGIALSNFSVQQ